MNRTTYGLDIAKNVMQLHWVDNETGEIGRKKLGRAKLSDFFARLQPARVVMEACGSAHHWARVLGALGHQIELLPARQVRPFVRSNKDDAADARAIWLAAQQSDIRRVPQKSVEQQAAMALHRTRAALGERAHGHDKRAAWHALRVRRDLPGGKRVGLKALATHRAEIDAKVPATIQRLIDGQLATLKDIGCRIDKLEAEIGMPAGAAHNAATLREVPGIGLLGATAFAATLGDGKCMEERAGVLGQPGDGACTQRHGRQGTGGALEQAWGPLPAHAAHTRRALGHHACQEQAEVARAVAGAPADERGGCGAGQQDGPHGLGAGGARAGL